MKDYHRRPGPGALAVPRGAAVAAAAAFPRATAVIIVEAAADAVKMEDL